MKVLISGGTGLIGRALTRSLLADGHQVWSLTRRSPAPSSPQGNLTHVSWDGASVQGWGELLSGMDVILNFAGEPLARWPWTQAKKERFWKSRVDAGKAISEAIRAATKRPRLLIQASGINHYGVRGDLADESTPPGDDFLSQLTVAWEGATAEVESMGVRRCVIRLAVVLDRLGGLYPLMSLPVRMFAGGPMGRGTQVFPWIHIEDVVRAIRFLIEHEEEHGAYSLLSPQATTNADFNRTLAKVIHRPCWLRIPAWVIKPFLGEMSILVLEGRAVTPRRLMDAGFSFKYENLEQALKQLESGQGGDQSR